MLKNRPFMLLLTGLALALALWLIVFVLQSGAGPKTPEAPSTQERANGPIAENLEISPASILSVNQSGDKYTLTGSGAPGAGLSLRAKETVLASTKVDVDGQWALGFVGEALDVTTKMDLLMATPDGRQIRSDQTLFVITNPHKPDEENGEIETAIGKSLILLSAAGAHSRVLQTPYESLPGKDGLVLEAIDYDNSGGVILSGTSVRRGKIRFYANDNLVGESRVDASGRWSLIFGNIMPLGKYNIGLEMAADAGGAVTKLTLPFERMQPMFGAENSPDVLVEHLPDRVQIGRALYGGGYQFTVLYAPLALVE